MGSRRNKCVSDLLNLIPKERIKVRKTPVYFPYNSIMIMKFKSYGFILDAKKGGSDIGIYISEKGYGF